MKRKKSLGYRTFQTANIIFLTIVTFACLFPMINVLAISFSASWAASAGLVILWPVGFNMTSYTFVGSNPQFLRALLVSLERVVLGVSLNMLMTIMTAYPLSREPKDFSSRKLFSWFFIMTILFSGGLVPWYLTINALGLMDSIWALVLPGLVPVFNVLLLMNFFRQLPKEIEESVFIDGGSHWVNLWKVIVPLSLPALATITLFAVIGHWNSWFDGLLLMNNPIHYPMQSYLRTVVIVFDPKLQNLSPEDLKKLLVINDRTTRAAQIFLGALPILLVYPFLQRYFMTGIVLGSVKG